MRAAWPADAIGTGGSAPRAARRVASARSAAHGTDGKSSCAEGRSRELDTSIGLVADPELTLWELLFETLTERLLLTRLPELVTATLLVCTCVWLFAFAGAACTLDTTCDSVFVVVGA